MLSSEAARLQIHATKPQPCREVPAHTEGSDPAPLQQWHSSPATGSPNQHWAQRWPFHASCTAGAVPGTPPALMGLLWASGLGVRMAWRLLSAQLSELCFSPRISDFFFFFFGFNKGHKYHLMTVQSERSGHTRACSAMLSSSHLCPGAHRAGIAPSPVDG